MRNKQSGRSAFSNNPSNKTIALTTAQKQVSSSNNIIGGNNNNQGPFMEQSHLAIAYPVLLYGKKILKHLHYIYIYSCIAAATQVNYL